MTLFVLGRSAAVTLITLRSFMPPMGNGETAKGPAHMRMRTALAATVGALALIVTVPTSASAADGVFLYVYSGLDGSPQVAALGNPASRECITLPEVANPSSSSPARHAYNDTDSTAVIFEGPGCTGSPTALVPHSGGERTEFRSVLFS
ncbi:hypothetical protein a10_07567 [Streptomyces acidiscabies]|nr:hypothetical protein a10_07567 [Streptomyces acidiscabies]GAV41237.1 hypothetical protein Saa2_04140 [Streptomyces acidiscabies]